MPANMVIQGNACYSLDFEDIKCIKDGFFLLLWEAQNIKEVWVQGERVK